MVEEIDPVKGPSQAAQKLHMQAKEAQASGRHVIQEQIASEEALTEFAELAEFNPLSIGKKFKELDTRADKALQEKAQEETEDSPHLANKVAEKYSTKNPELSSRALMALRAYIKPSDTLQDLLAKVRSTYPDPTLTDEALDFLIESHPARGELKTNLTRAKETFNEIYGREIKAGKNIRAQATTFSQAGLGSPTALRDLYRQVTGNPQSPNQLFEDLSNQFPFQEMKKVISFLLRSLGSDIKSQGPSIPMALLQKILGDIRNLQAILGIYRFFQSRMKLIEGEFAREDMDLPALVNFQLLAKVFMRMIQERYPSPDRILQLAKLLGISEELAAQIIIYTQYRDALRNVSPKLFKSDKHRQDLLMCVIDALTDLEDELEDDDEDDDEDEEDE